MPLQIAGIEVLHPLLVVTNLSISLLGLKNLTYEFAKRTNTMLLGDQFQMTLLSNVTGYEKNTRVQYETTLATPLDLHDEWEVALIDNTYFHS